MNLDIDDQCVIGLLSVTVSLDCLDFLKDDPFDMDSKIFLEYSIKVLRKLKVTPNDMAYWLQENFPGALGITVEEIDEVFEYIEDNFSPVV